MPLDEILQRLKTDGFYLFEEIILEDRIRMIRDSVLKAQEKNNKRSEVSLEKTRSRGHRVGAKGVASLKQVINETQTFATYLSDRRIMIVVEAIFGPFARISCTDCVVNNPGNERGYWHADWPYNATNASHIPSPYPDAILHLSTIWMLTSFNVENGGTFIIPGSHRVLKNPAAGQMPEINTDAPYPTETQICGNAGSVLIYDSRLWHAVAPNRSSTPRVALIVRYAPWWLNLNPAMIGTPEHTRMVVETGGKNYETPPVRADVYASLPNDVKPLYRHWVGKGPSLESD